MQKCCLENLIQIKFNAGFLQFYSWNLIYYRSFEDLRKIIAFIITFTLF